MASVIRLERKGHIGILTFSRPDTMNALGEGGDGEEIAAACSQIASDKIIRVAILTGEGRAFSAGGNVKAMRDGTGSFAGDPACVREGYRGNIHVALRALYALDVPLIAAVNGPAIGLGCDIACLADIRVASSDARFGVTFLKIGLIPGDGGTWLLPRIVGMSRAAELFYTGRLITAEQAAEWGLVSQVCKPEALMDTALQLADEIARQPAAALRATKMLLRQGQTVGYDTMLELAASTQGLMHHTQDHQEGVNALIEKREPRFGVDRE